MKYEIKITEKAEKDIRGIYNYIAMELLAPETAANLLNKLEKSISELDYMPSRFRKYGSELWQSRGLRIDPVVKSIEVFIITAVVCGIVVVVIEW